jgi:rRNA maturation RNase YbeY
MVANSIQFHCADIHFVLRNKTAIRLWIAAVARQHNRSIQDIQFIFCSDEYLLNINRQFLQHDYYTDIITFDNSTTKHLIVEAYISIDRIRDNAKQLGLASSHELHRVMIHGVLHALGFKDKRPADVRRMRAAEDTALDLFQGHFHSNRKPSSKR